MPILRHQSLACLRHPERSEGSLECGTVPIPEILRYALDDCVVGGLTYP